MLPASPGSSTSMGLLTGAAVLDRRVGGADREQRDRRSAYPAARLLAALPDPSIYEPPETLKALFDLYRRMTAPVRVNGRGPFPFVVDTGANQSVIAEGLAAHLGLSGPLELLHSTTGAQLAPTTGARLDCRRPPRG